MPHATERRALRGIALFPAALLCAVALCSAASVLRAQSPSSVPGDLRFEVASVKPNPKTLSEHFLSGGAGTFSGIRVLPGGTLQASWVDVRLLIRRAYDLKPYQLTDGPTWIDSDKFDVMARAGRDATPDEINAMLRALLAERFGLRIRVEDRPGDVYALTMARSDGRLGRTMTPASAECVERLDRGDVPSGPPPRPTAVEPDPVCGRNSRSGSGATTRWALGGVKTDMLVLLLGAELDGPLEDRSGLTGRYDAVLEYHSSFVERLEGIRADSGTSTAPVLSDALRDQLGLRLEKTRGTIPVTVIEAVARPTPD